MRKTILSRLLLYACALVAFLPLRAACAQLLPVYGNYGMPGHRGGGTPTGEFPKDFAAPAIDSLDELFKQHDQAYWAAELVGGAKEREFKCEGDRRLIDGLSGLLQISVSEWEHRPPNAAKALAFATGALAGFRAKVRSLCGREGAR